MDAHCGSLLDTHKRSFSARAVKTSFVFGIKFNNSVFASEKRIISSLADILTRMIFRASLANYNLANRYFLAVLQFHSQPLGDRISP